MDDAINKELLQAVISKRLRQVKQLLERGADPNYYEDSAKIRPLHFAALYNAVKIIPVLVAAGGNMYATTESNDTPLLIAKQHNHAPMILLLKKFCKIYTVCRTKQ